MRPLNHHHQHNYASTNIFKFECQRKGQQCNVQQMVGFENKMVAQWVHLQLLDNGPWFECRSRSGLDAMYKFPA